MNNTPDARRSGGDFDTPSGDPALRLIYADRRQLCWTMLDVELLVGPDDSVRAIWELVGRLDLSAFASRVGSFEGAAGRPAYDPALLVSQWIYAYSRGIGSAREIERRLAFDPGFRWLAGLMIINHHTLSDFRVAHHSALGLLFTQLLPALSAEGLISLETATLDGTKIAAQAGAGTFRKEDQLVKHLAFAKEHLSSMGDPRKGGATSRQEAAQARARRERVERLEEALDNVRQISADKPAGYRNSHKRQIGASSSGPQSRIMRHGDGHFALSYNVQIVTDTSHGIAIGVDIGQTAPDYGYLPAAMRQIEERLGELPDKLLVDAGYTSRQNVLMAHNMNVELAGPWVQTDGRVKQRFQRAGVTEAFLPEQFRYDPNSDVYVCPEGKNLTARQSHSARPGRQMTRYQANQNDCWSCPSRQQCCSSNKRYGRSIVVTQEDPVVSSVRERQTTAEARGLMRERARVAEFVNAWLKEKLGLRRFRVRGLQKARTEALWAILAYNVRQWIRLRWKPSLAM